MWDAGTEEACQYDRDGRGFIEEGKVRVTLGLGFGYWPTTEDVIRHPFIGLRRRISWKYYR